MGEPPAKILILNDDPDLVRTIGDLFRDEGYSVETRPTRAIEDVIAVAPDLVHVDCPPDAAGEMLNFLQRLRLTRAIAHVPVLLAVSSTKWLEPAVLRTHLIHVLVRPYDIETLLDAVRDLIAAGRNRRGAPESRSEE